MKMLTLWACIDSSDHPIDPGEPDAVMAWKQAWKSVSPAAKQAAPGNVTMGQPHPRQSVT